MLEKIESKNKAIKHLQIKSTEFELNEVKLTEKIRQALDQMMESEQHVLELQNELATKS